MLPAALHALEAQAWKPRCVLFDASAVAAAGDEDAASAAANTAGLRAVAADLKARVEKRQSPDDLQEWLEGVHEGVAEDQQVSELGSAEAGGWGTVTVTTAFTDSGGGRDIVCYWNWGR